MTRTFAALVLLAAAGPLAAKDDESPAKEPPATEVLDSALAAAKRGGKDLFLVFSAPECSWCRRLERFHADPDVSTVLGKHFVLVEIDTVKNPGGEELYRKYGPHRGVPAWTILDADRKELADSMLSDVKEPTSANVGFPNKPEEIDHYVKALKTSCPDLSDADCQLLAKKLKEFGSAR